METAKKKSKASKDLSVDEILVLAEKSIKEITADHIRTLNDAIEGGLFVFGDMLDVGELQEDPDMQKEFLGFAHSCKAMEAIFCHKEGEELIKKTLGDAYGAIDTQMFYGEIGGLTSIPDSSRDIQMAASLADHDTIFFQLAGATDDCDDY